MNFKKYKKPIILFFTTFGFFIIFSIITIIFKIGIQATNYVKIIKFDTTGYWILYSFGMVVLVAIIGGLLGGYLLGPIFLYLHKSTIGRKMEYGIEIREKPEKFNYTFRALFPALTSINLALLLVINEDIVNNFVYIEKAGGEGVLITLGLLLSITVGISMFLFGIAKKSITPFLSMHLKACSTACKAPVQIIILSALTLSSSFKTSIT